MVGERAPDSCVAMAQNWSRNDVVADKKKTCLWCLPEGRNYSVPTTFAPREQPLVVKLIGDNGRPGFVR